MRLPHTGATFCGNHGGSAVVIAISKLKHKKDSIVFGRSNCGSIKLNDTRRQAKRLRAIKNAAPAIR